MVLDVLTNKLHRSLLPNAEYEPYAEKVRELKEELDAGRSIEDRLLALQEETRERLISSTAMVNQYCESLSEGDPILYLSTKNGDPIEVTFLHRTRNGLVVIKYKGQKKIVTVGSIQAIRAVRMS